MIHLSSRVHRSSLAALFVALALVGIGAASAVGAGAYTVHVLVPGKVTRGQQFVVRVYGESANASQLSVFLGQTRCGRTTARERKHGGARIIVSRVIGSYAHSRALAGGNVGRRVICAYLRSVSPPTRRHPRARAVHSFTVVR